MALLTPPGGLLTVVIVTWNVCEYLEACLQSLVDAGVTRWARIVVVDSASTDDSAAMVTRRFPFVDVVVSATNIGYSRGNNLALRSCQSTYALLLNPDTLVPAGTLEALVDVLEREPQVGAVGPRQLGGDGRVQMEGAVQLPTIWNALCDLAMLSRLFPRSRVFARRTMGWWDHLDDRDVPAIPGSALMLRMAALDRADLLDPTMFYVEDMDLCRRLGLSGWRVRYLGSVALTHFGGQSTQQGDDEGLYRQMAYQSFWLYLRKHDGLLQAGILSAGVATVTIAGGAAVAFVRRLPGLPAGISEALGRYGRLLGALRRWSLADKHRFSHPLAAAARDPEGGR